MSQLLRIAARWGGLVSLVVAVSALAAPFEEGLEAEKQLRLYEARDLFRQAVRDDPDAAGVAEHIGWFLFLNGFHDDECRELLRRGMTTGQEPAAMERAARQVERELGLRPAVGPEERSEQQAFDAAMLEKAATGSVGQLGGARVDAGDFDRGIPLLEEALAADPDDGPLELRLARAFYWAQRTNEADQAYRRLNARYPRRPALLLEHAQVAASLEELERAQGLLIAAERLRPGDARILLERARIEARLVNRQAALDAVGRMARSDRAKPPAALAVGRAEHYRGQFGPAREAYAAALAAAPFLEEAAHGLVEVRLRRGELGEASNVLAAWLPRERSLDWRPRTDLFEELTDPRLHGQFATYSNSLGYFESDFGLAAAAHPTPELMIRPALINSIVTQSGFSSIDRQGGMFDLASRPSETFA
ncbi:MAG: tetratricopeptide repeat protein [Pirellulales bacterium]|nr:tetratricopeptide repeat protein [Pirellulales bacterium]